jgi:hypothetical protein
MDRDSSRARTQRASLGADVPGYIHVNVWVFMLSFSVGPALCVVLMLGSTQLADQLKESLATVGLFQAGLWMAQRRCSSEDLSYWDGLLVAATSVTTGRNLSSLLRTYVLLFAVVLMSVVFAVDHDRTCPGSHAGLRFGKLVICLYKQRRPRLGNS